MYMYFQDVEGTHQTHTTRQQDRDLSNALSARVRPSKFQSLLKQFTQYWASREPEFIQFFEQHYANRPGK